MSRLFLIIPLAIIAIWAALIAGFIVAYMVELRRDDRVEEARSREDAEMAFLEALWRLPHRIGAEL